MSPDEIRAQAIDFAKKHKGEIADELTDTSRILSDEHPISVFMAGSPGAGKTEFSKELIGILEKDGQRKVLRIDGDDLRQRMPEYVGNNSDLFQGAISIVVDKIHDSILEKRQSFILDGTFAKYEKASHNIRRSLNKHRSIFIFYVYQTPSTAWRFTQAREQLEGRNIPKSAFIEQFCGAKETVEKLHREFTDKIVIFLVKKDFNSSATKEMVKIVDPNTSIDAYVGEHYTKEELEKSL
ncbi:MAG TPA: zeta toxin family protein [Candidatus Paceibacterota bacterium]|nr:zeta toxin family protein [Candidatus Paceibacterota bacterium]